MNEHLISSKEMAQFVASGYLKFEEMVPKDLSDACLEDMKNHRGYLEVGTPFEETWPKGTPLGDVFRLPQVKGLIHSLVGPNPVYDHHAVHLLRANSMAGTEHAPGLGHRLSRELLRHPVVVLRARHARRDGRHLPDSRLAFPKRAHVRG